MKQLVLLFLLLSSTTALVFADGWGKRWGPPGPARPQMNSEAANVSGKLTLEQGMIAIVNDTVTYYVMGLGRYTGFIDGLKEGAQVTLEGRAMTNPRDAKIKILHPNKLTINGKEYEIGRQRQPRASTQT